MGQDPHEHAALRFKSTLQMELLHFWIPKCLSGTKDLTDLTLTEPPSKLFNFATLVVIIIVHIFVLLIYCNTVSKLLIMLSNA